MITIETIPHDHQSYETVGDWKVDKNGDIRILVSSMNNWKYEFLVAFHELAEVMLCKHEGITEKSVTTFDLEFEKNRPEGNTEEPGDDPSAPYQAQHNLASGIERIMAASLGVSWKKYGDKVNSLCQKTKS